ncbi:MAG TPA: PEP-utilizing enzyme [Mycobacterium sp.]
MSTHIGHVAHRVQHVDGCGQLARESVGGKAHSIHKMMSLGIPVPPAFVLTTDVCREYHARGRELPDEAADEVRRAMATLAERTGRRFGSAQHPLLVSVRSGAAMSMPGMMDTVLNLGMTDDIEAALAAETGDVAGMSASVAVLTELGGWTSHAAVVCREMAVPCVVGCGIDTVTALAGQVVTVDAGNGAVHLGKLAVHPPASSDGDLGEDLRVLEHWLRDELDEHDPDVGVLSLLEGRSATGAAQ